MVFFTCNACNESLKKNQVEKHYTQRCRRCEFLSCVDCGKEFWGDTYQSHIKCISEEEKYSGKDFVSKPNKGEVKQELWIQKVQSAIQKAPPNPQLKTLLTRLEDFPNVPRKKAKFENFLKCSLRVFNGGLMNQVWELLMAEKQQGNGNSIAAEETKSADSSKTDSSVTNTETTQSESVPEQKLSKRERKEERKRKAHKAEKKDKDSPDNGVENGEREKKRKKGKRKADEEDEEEEEEVKQAEVESQPKKKKRKVENGATEENIMTTENGTQDEEDSVLSERKTGKFDWCVTIMAVLQSKGEISVKKLRKKVLAEYASYESNKPEDKILATFNKKLSKLPTVRVLKDRARLVQS